MDPQNLPQAQSQKPIIPRSHLSLSSLLISGALLFLTVIIGSIIVIIILMKNGYLTQPQTTNQSDNIKRSLLKADNVSFVTLGVALNFIPTEKITNLYGDHAYNLTFFGTKLNANQLPKITLALTSKDQSADSGSQTGFSLESLSWNVYTYTMSTVVAVKEGYVCYVPMNTGRICAPDGSGCTPLDLTFRCVNVLDQKNNTKENVSQFIYDSLKQMGISCNLENCPVEQSPEYMSIPQFSRSELYFQDLAPSSDSNVISSVNTDIQKSLKSFKQSGWKYSLENSTQQEASWSGNTRIIHSKTIHANNLTFSCTHEITAWETSRHIFEKRQMIDCWVNLKT